MDKADIEKKIKGVLEHYGLDEKQLSTNASFIYDLGLDSLDFAELILTVEQIFDISISFKKDNIDTIGDLVNTIESMLNTNFIKKS